ASASLPSRCKLLPMTQRRARSDSRPRITTSLTNRHDTTKKPPRPPKQIRANNTPPTPAPRRFDRREILCSTDDVIGSARGLRVGGKRRRSCEQQRDRKGERDFAHQFSP